MEKSAQQYVVIGLTEPGELDVFAEEESRERAMEAARDAIDLGWHSLIIFGNDMLGYRER